MSYTTRKKQFEIERNKEILSDADLSKFLSRYLTSKEERLDFIRHCLQKVQTRQMLLRLHWYVDLAHDFGSVKLSRPSLQIIFLMSMAEALARYKKRYSKMGSKDAIHEFFKEILSEDESLMKQKFRRSLASNSSSQLTFKSIVNILYQVRNDAVHGKAFWKFHLSDERDLDQGMSLITEGYLGPQNRKRRESLELTLTYKQLVDVFVRTGLENIKTVLK